MHGITEDIDQPTHAGLQYAQLQLRSYSHCLITSGLNA